jgi:20S proteasome alpha/beta subunit
MLDCEADYKHQSDAASKPALTLERATALIMDGLTSAAERDVNTGDGAIVFMITNDSIKEEMLPLRKD